MRGEYTKIDGKKGREFLAKHYGEAFKAMPGDFEIRIPKVDKVRHISIWYKGIRILNIKANMFVTKTVFVAKGFKGEVKKEYTDHGLTGFGSIESINWAEVKKTADSIPARASGALTKLVELATELSALK